MLTFKEIIQIIDRQEEANILLSALALDIFTVLGKEHLTVRQIIKKAKTSPDATELLLNALVAMGILNKKGKHFSNTSEGYKHLCAHSNNYKKGILMLRMNQQSEWNKLTQVVKNGRNLEEYEGPDDPEFRRLFSYAMHERSDKFVSKIANAITHRRVGRLLDIGAGPGSYSIAVLKRDKQAYATLIDRPVALKVARDIIPSGNIRKRIEFIEGDLFNVHFGDGYNTTLYSNILHIYDKRQNRAIFKKIHRALKPSGKIFLNDLFLKDNRLGPYDAALFSLTMLLYTARGRTYTFEETEIMLEESGFHKFKRFPLNGGSTLIEATRI